MNRNSQSHFAMTPTVDIGRSKFDRSYNYKTSFNTGDLIPYFVADVMPGDTLKMNTSQVVRMMTPITPVMDNANLDTYFFFVPYRLVWEHFQEFMGENKTEPWIQRTEYEIPQIVAPEGGFQKGSLADYFGVPTKVGGIKFSALPARAYCLIWNEFFRDENLKTPCYIHMGEADLNGKNKGNNYDYVTDTECMAAPLKAARYHDLFSSCTIEPQKGPSVTVPLGETAPVIAGNSITSPEIYTDTTRYGNQYYSNASGTISVSTPEGTDIPPTYGTTNGLVTDLSNAVGATITQLRMAFQIQKFYEKAALYGTRFIETIKAHFGVTNPDFRLQRPEYLGGVQTPINMNQVIQTDATRQSSYYDEVTSSWKTADATPQGNAAAFSLTSGRDKDLFTHSFTEWGIVIGLAVVRQVHTYQQGLNRLWSKKKMTDFYFPEFANLSNMPIYNREIYMDGTSADDEVWGYNEAWASERFQPDIVTGEMRSNYDQSLDVWHWADYYETRPSFSSQWIDETDENIKRTIAVQNHDQFMGDFFFLATWTRPMPLYSIPGLIDHH